MRIDPAKPLPPRPPSRALAALLLLAGACSLDRVQDPQPVDPGEVVPGLIDFEVRGVSEEHRALARSLGDIEDDEAVADRPVDALLPRAQEEEFFEVRTRDSASALATLRARGDILYAEPVVRVSALFTPDDPLYAKQWHLAAAGAPSAWEAARGAGVTVAVLDTGVAPLDDLDGARLLTGFNFLTRSGAVGAAADDHFHGTHVAGTIAESTDNARGGAGMAPLAKILPLKVLSAAGSGTSAGIAEAIRYAADHGAQVINLSLGGGARSSAMAFAVSYAQRKGVLIVAAAGNTGQRGVSFPAAYPEALAVSASSPSGTLAPYSAFGPEVGLAAPGGDKSQGEERGVLQQTLDEAGRPGYRFLQGTSMAAPHVSGAAALLASLGVTNPGAIARVLEETASAAPEDGSGLSRAERYGHGLLDAGAAVRRVTTIWGLERLALALLGAWIALGHARKVQHLRARETARPALWGALAVFSGGLAIAAPLGYARLPVLDLLAMAPAAMPMRWLGLAGGSLPATLAAWLAWSALIPILLAGVSRLATPDGKSAIQTLPGAAAAGLAFGQAGLLLQSAGANAVHLPGLPPVFAVLWLTLNASACWLAGRALMARGG